MSAPSSEGRSSPDRVTDPSVLRELAGSGFDIRIFLDEKCPLCAREGRLLERLDGDNGRVDLEDLSAPEFDPSQYGLTQELVEARIHGVLPDGTIVEGVDVFRHAYAAVGFERLAAIANWRGIRGLLDWAYLIFAKNRLRLTGRGPKTCAVPSNAGSDGSPSRLTGASSKS